MVWCGVAPLPAVFDVLVDEAGDHHGHDGVVPGRDEHEGETQAHPQERQRPAGGDGRGVYRNS